MEKTDALKRQELRSVKELTVRESKRFSRKQALMLACKCLLLFVLFLLFSNAKINGSVAPFAVGFAFALLLAYENPLVFGLTFLAAQVLVSPAVSTVLIALCYLSVLVFAYFLFKFTKKALHCGLASVFMILGSSGYLYYHVGSTTEILQSVLFIVLALVFCYVTYRIVRAVKVRGLGHKFTLDENICLSVFIMAAALGLFQVFLFNVSIAHFVVCLGVLLASRMFSNKVALYFAALAGLGLAFANNSVIPLAVFCAWAVVVSSLKDSGKIASCVGVLAIDFLLGAYFNGYPVYTIFCFISVAAACLIFVCLPSSLFEKLRRNFDFNFAFSGAYLMDYDREETKNRLASVSKIFANMGESYQKMAIRDGGTLDGKNIICDEVIGRLCRNCENFARCHREKNIMPDIEHLARAGLEKKKASLVDVSKNIATTCAKVSSLLSSINAAVQNAVFAREIGKMQENGRYTVGEQLVGTSRILENLAYEFNSKTSTNRDLAMKLSEELLCAEIVTKEVVILEKDKFFDSVFVVTRRSEDEQKLAEIASRLLRVKFSFKVSDAKQAGWKVVELKPANKFDLIVGVASSSCGKEQFSGDSHAFVEISDSKTMIALCDGMGCGTSAKETSEETIALIENFYRAGFSSNIILSQVSKLLASSGKEVFSTLDVVIFDAATGNADFVKACAPPTVIKRGDEAFLVRGEALPFGIVESNPSTLMHLLQPGDIVILASDGVVDCFGTEEEYLSFCNNERLINMNLLSESILEEALLKSGGVAKDDMTVICCRIHANV